MAKVFISFVHEDQDYAEAVQHFITRMLGTDAHPFLSSDKFQIYAGENWLNRIMEEIKDAKVAVLIMSEKSAGRPWVNFESGAAWMREIPIIPVCVDGFEKDSLPKPYSNWQAVELGEISDNEYLARSVAHYLGLSEPYSRKYTGIGALGGPEGIKREEREKQAYDLLFEDLEKIAHLRMLMSDPDEK